MDSSLFLVGLVKLAFGLLVGALGIFLAFRVLARILGTLVAPPHASTATGILEGGSVVALGILVRNTLSATYDAVDLLLARHQLAGLGKMALFAVLHLCFTLLVGVAVLAVGLALFNRLTPQVDELEEVKKGNVGAALVLAAILLVLAFLTAPGLQAALNGLVPFPELPDQPWVPPS